MNKPIYTKLFKKIIRYPNAENRKRDFHSNFKLSGNGEQIGLYFEGDLMDEIMFEDDVKRKVSYGRVIDGSTDWTIFKSPSPGSSNQSSDNYAETLK